jgi:drug/metabolite transporter (DMT)-like permease
MKLLLHRLTPRGISAALLAALLFGAGTPLAKWLMGDVQPWMLAGLLYLGSGLGLGLFRRLSGAAPVQLAPGEWRWLLGAIASGGVVGPVLLMMGLSGMPASGASLLLNAEGVFTAVLAWVAFRENVDRRIALGMAAIAAGALVLSWPSQPGFAGAWPALCILGACLAWALDNNLTRKVSLHDASWIACAKGLVAGSVNLLLALLLGNAMPALPALGGAMLVGLLAYGVSLVLFVVGLRELGTARTGAYFSLAPFFGAALGLATGEPLTWQLAVAAALMGLGLWLHLTEHHAHPHVHEAMDHSHPHSHDLHHQHDHPDQPGLVLAPGEVHTHAHHHTPLHHSHPHYPDAHHQHAHP